MSYGTEFDRFRRAGGSRPHPKGEKPSELPVQAPSKFDSSQSRHGEALGLTIPSTLLARADEVIQ